MSELLSVASKHEAAILAWIHETAPYGIITTDRELKIKTWNRWMEVHSGKKLEAVVGQSLFSLFPDLRQRGLAPRFTRALEGEVSVLSTALHRYLLSLPPSTRDTAFSQMQQTARISPLVCNGEILGTVIVIEDVTERELQASLLQRQNNREKSLAWALGHLLESQEPRRIVRDLFCKVAELFDVDAYFLFLREPDGVSLRLQAAGGIAPEVQDHCSTVNESSPLGAVLLNTRQPTALEHLGAPGASDAAWHADFGFHACALLPLVVASGDLGVLGFATRSRPSLQEGELDLLSTIGQYLAVALEKETINLQLRAAQAALSHQALGLEKVVNERTGRLREMVTELETFTHTVAHDLRAPIRALSGYCDVLSEDFAAALPQEAKDVIDRLHDACAHLDALTRDLLEFAKISREEISLAPVDVEALLKEELSVIRSGSVSVELRPPFYWVLAQRTLLRQSLSNLLDNAFKFVAPGRTAHIRVYTELVPANAEGEPPPPLPLANAEGQPSLVQPDSAPARAPGPSRQVRIIVQDDGIGVAPEAQGKIFGIFERGIASPLYPGSGIGLAVVARAMQRMGGAYGVQSEVGSGSRFWLELPLA